MGLNNYIFLTTEGYTFQPNSEFGEPDIENVQVIGFAQGKNPEVAFENLLKENRYLLDTNFHEIFSYQLDKKYKDKCRGHYIAKNK